MDAFPIVVLSRVLHVLAAIFLFGGSLFLFAVLTPSAKELPENEHEALKERVMKKWRAYVGMAIGALIFTGFYNYLVVAGPEHNDVGDKKYHMFMGIKILIAFVVFFFASVLPGRAKAFEKMRQNSRKWSIVTIVLATVVVAIAGFLRVRGVIQ
ncbi:hypothetical protein OAF98_04060 [Planctomicrobium sp.]|jgi:uncharacterized membrane protein|nr:hypothetical protein [Planctomicrobium sp.]MBT5019207.1 hypothetical protein [Planctomicrobium sp.]MDB4743638.1 hypothetical protein [Planctomicrobium sp.]